MITPDNISEKARGWLLGESLAGFHDFDISGNPLESYDAANLQIVSAMHSFRREFSFAVPTAEIVEELRKYEPILEVAAGTGFWSAILGLHGIDVWPTDKETVRNEHGQTIALQQDVENLDAEEAVRIYDMNVLMVWPTDRDDWPERTILAMPSDTYLIHVGEGPGGCCASEKFFEILSRDFEEMETTVILPRWYGFRDDFGVYRKL